MNKNIFNKIILWGVITYLLVIIIYNGLFIYTHWGSIDFLASNEFGDFLAGIFAPLAFLFLYLGYLQNSISLKIQGDELQASTEALKGQVQEMQLAIQLQKDEIDARHFSVMPRLEYKYNNYNEMENNTTYFDENDVMHHDGDVELNVQVSMSVVNVGGDAYEYQILHPLDHHTVFHKSKLSNDAETSIEFFLTEEEVQKFFKGEKISNIYIVYLMDMYGRTYEYQLDFSFTKTKEFQNYRIYRLVPTFIGVK